ncbi:hypothetical protein MASR1M45_29230 [Candidatus Kapaibacterium sp.]
MAKYKVKYSVKVNNIIPDRTLQNNIVPAIENRERIFELKTEMQIYSITDLPNTELANELIKKISLEDVLNEISEIKRID